jgi:hypothetical protein
MGYLIWLVQEGSPFSFLEAYRELRYVCQSKIYRVAMEHYNSPPGARAHSPLAEIEVVYFCVSRCKARMLIAALANKPVR